MSAHPEDEVIQYFLDLSGQKSSDVSVTRALIPLEQKSGPRPSPCPQSTVHNVCILQQNLFMLEPERAYCFTLTALRLTGGLPPACWLLGALYSAPPQPVSAFGLTFKNPVGLAAGYDKDGVAVRGLAALGFGHIEVGTVDPPAAAGNPQPGSFDSVKDRAYHRRSRIPQPWLRLCAEGRLNPGPKGSWMMDMVGASPQRKPGCYAHALRRTAGCIIGVNIGKNQNTPVERRCSTTL